ncbi:MAG: hypothetical protein K8S87_07935 [Planctomycetes bacterium]|nr:hypothetical protein [Planctomycetota bacterium]
MKIFTIVLGCILFVLFMANTSFASDDFQTRPPVFVYGERPKNVDPVFAYGERPKNVDVEIQTDRIGYRYKSPFLYFSMGIQTESTWFDRRLNWTSYSTQLAVDTGHFGIKYQGSMSNVGREDFELFDSRLDVYGYWMLDAFDTQEFGLTRIGGGLSYFDCEPYQGQEFLNNQHYAAYVNVYYIIAELKFVMMINDDVWNGGLVELKIFNPFLYFGFQIPDIIDSIFPFQELQINAVLPYEFGITGSFGLPNDADGWGWFVKGRYNFLYPVNKEENGNLSVGAEIYWIYKDGIGNTQVSESVEFGIKFTMVGF